MSVEGLQVLNDEIEREESEREQQAEQSQPGYQSAEDIRERCREKAIWMVGGIEAILSKIKPEATHLVMDEKHCVEGVDAFTDVLMLHPDVEPPAWMAKYMPYAVLLFWMSKTGWQVHMVDQQLKAQETEQEQQQEGGDNG